MIPTPKPKRIEKASSLPGRLKDKVKKVQPAKKKKKPRQRSIKRLKADAWKLMSIKIRNKYAIDGMVACYTCGAVAPIKEMQAGHGVAGRGNAVLFLEEIIKPQCVACNVFNHGKYQVFVPKLIREIGQEVYEQIEKDSHKPVKRNREYYLNLIENLSMKLERVK